VCRRETAWFARPRVGQCVPDAWAPRTLLSRIREPPLTAGCGDGFFTKGDGFVGSKNIAVNIQGLDYDDATFVKIDLVFEDATAVGLTS
jgi:hypothetical protein